VEDKDLDQDLFPQETLVSTGEETKASSKTMLKRKLKTSLCTVQRNSVLVSIAQTPLRSDSVTMLYRLTQPVGKT
jgi:hypothetical protein